ncbi:MAG: HAMP domain-containing histidine kinase [Eggerthellaceae bacterium]|nr:HAMP domain-containing histidine kinase [Eggerthellaceae bacterium]
MTALIAFGILSFVWEQHFHTYTRENIQNISNNTASQIATRYEAVHAWGNDILIPAEAATRFSPSVGVQVVDAKGTLLYDSTHRNGRRDFTLLPLDEESIATAPIVVDHETVGAVRVWVYGSSTLLTQADEEFRARSYQAMIIAALIAIVLAGIVGTLFARGLVNPINRISRTAKAFGEGDLSARTMLTGDDEIAQLGQTFDSMAESVEKDRELEHRLTTDVAHELRTPLMAIQSTVEAMIDGVFEADEERLETLDSEVQRLSRLVDAILKLSRLENHNTQLKREVVDVGELITTLVSTHEAYIKESGLELSTKFEHGVYVYADPDLIRQAVANLISNAVRYTPQGSITISVSHDDNNAYIVVADTGIGLSEEEAKMVFSRFWRAESGRNREQGGLGVGLALVHEIVEQHNGKIKVQSEVGIGSTFTIALPLYNEETEREARRRTRSENRKAESSFDEAWDEDEI